MTQSSWGCNAHPLKMASVAGEQSSEKATTIAQECDRITGALDELLAPG